MQALFSNLLEQAALLLGGSLGLAIIAVTLLIRIVLLPLLLPSVKTQKKLRDIQPKLNQLKELHGDDKTLFAKKQMELYKEHNINPIAGCLPNLIQIGLFIMFYQVLTTTLKESSATQFLWLNLQQPDRTFVFPVLTALTQFVLGVMILPGTDTTAEHTLAKKTKTKKDDKKADDATEMAKTMQQQMVFIMPFVSGFIALSFPSGLALYWVTNTLFSLVQQYFVSGWGGLEPYLKKLSLIKS